MTEFEQEKEGSFCLHISEEWNIVSKILFFTSLKFQLEKNYVFANQNSCLNKNCIYFYEPIYLSRNFFIDLQMCLVNSDSLLHYGGFKQLNFFPWPKVKKITPPIWSPERFLQVNFIGPLVVLSRDLKSEKINLSYEKLFNLLLRYSVERLNQPYGLLIHSNNRNKSKSHFLAVKEYLNKERPLVKVEQGFDGILRLNYELMAPESISIVIPTRGTKINGQIALVELIKSIDGQKFNETQVEIVVVYDVDSNLSYLDEIKVSSKNIQIKKIPFQPPFNFSKKCNLGAASSSGEVIIFLNDDTKTITPNGVLSMAGLATLPKVGAVGAKLFFDNGTVQHAGIFVTGGNVGHAYFKQVNPKGPFGDLTVSHEVSGVTGACLAQRREVWKQSGGWDEEFPNSYNDVEYCFRLRHQGLTIIQNNSAELFHYESLTRDPSFSIQAKNLLEKKWNKYLIDDLYFPEYVKTQQGKQDLKRILKRVARKLNFR